MVSMGCSRRRETQSEAGDAYLVESRMVHRRSHDRMGSVIELAI